MQTACPCPGDVSSTRRSLVNAACFVRSSNARERTTYDRAVKFLSRRCERANVMHVELIACFRKMLAVASRDDLLFYSHGLQVVGTNGRTVDLVSCKEDRVRKKRFLEVEIAPGACTVLGTAKTQTRLSHLILRNSCLTSSAVYICTTMQSAVAKP